MSKRIIAGALAGAVLASTMAPMGVYADSPEVNIWVSKVNATDSGMEKGLEKQIESIIDECIQLYSEQ